MGNKVRKGVEQKFDENQNDLFYCKDEDANNGLLMKGEIGCKIIEFYDGDTVKILFYLCSNAHTTGRVLIKTNLRLKGIDAPEKRTNNPLEKEKAFEITEELNRLYKGRMAITTFIKNDKYGGRIVGTLSINGEDISKKLLTLGWVKPYEGKKKEEWTTKELKRIIVEKTKLAGK
jgi:micrococcal nuclease